MKCISSNMSNKKQDFPQQTDTKRCDCFIISRVWQLSYRLGCFLKFTTEHKCISIWRKFKNNIVLLTFTSISFSCLAGFGVEDNFVKIDVSSSFSSILFVIIWFLIHLPHCQHNTSFNIVLFSFRINIASYILNCNKELVR